jgi:hypothetical protein
VALSQSGGVIWLIRNKVFQPVAKMDLISMLQLTLTQAIPGIRVLGKVLIGKLPMVGG